MYTDIPKEKLDAWWEECLKSLDKDPTNLDTIRTQVLLENEYNRRGWKTPE